MRSVLVVLSVLLMFTIPIVAQETMTPEEICNAATPADDPDTREFEAAEDVLEPGLDYHAIFCTEAGAVYVDLFETLTPITVNNLVFLAENDFYNNITFHRVLEDFMAQGGDPTGTGTGGPGYRFQDEFVAFLTFDRPGLLAMANAGENTNGSQFFLTTSMPDYLNFRHTIFGEVIYGQDTVENLPLRDPESAQEPGPELDTVIIITEPETVDVELEAVDAYSQDQYQELLDQFPDDIGLEGITKNVDESMIVDTEAVDGPEGTAEFLSDHNHQYSVKSMYSNADCSFDPVALQSFGYTIHVFETVADAQAAIDDPFFLTLVTDDHVSEPSESEFYGLPVYSWGETLCDESEGTHASIFRQIGRVITVTESVFPPAAPVTAEGWLDQITVQLYEPAFAAALRQELSQ